MTWKGIKPIVHYCQKVYESGISLTTQEMKPDEDRIDRSNSLPKWDITIEPLTG
jgi:hypothetical protein